MNKEAFAVGSYSALRKDGDVERIITVNLYGAIENCPMCGRSVLLWSWADHSLTHCSNCVSRPARVTDSKIKLYNFLLPFRLAARIEYYQNLKFWPITTEYREMLIKRVEIAEQEMKVKKKLQSIKTELTDQQPGQAKMLVS